MEICDCCGKKFPSCTGPMCGPCSDYVSKHIRQARAAEREKIAKELEEGHIVTEMGIDPYREWFPQAAAFVRQGGKQ